MRSAGEALEDQVAQGGGVEVADGPALGDDPPAAASGTASSRPRRAPTSARGRRSPRCRRGSATTTPASAARPQNAVVGAGRTVSGGRPAPAPEPLRTLTATAPASSTCCSSLGGGGRVEHRDVGRREDAVLVAVAPVLVEPPVEGRGTPGRRPRDRRFSASSMPTPSVGNRSAAAEALLVHHLQAHVAVAVLGAQRLELAERVADRLLAGVAAVPVVERAGLGHGVERRVGDVGVDGAADQQAAPAVDVGPADPPVAAASGPGGG